MTDLLIFNNVSSLFSKKENENIRQISKNIKNEKRKKKKVKDDVNKIK